MKTDIFMPQKLKIGFQTRNDTYTGRLAYVTYYDNKGVLRKKPSWEGWRSPNIEPLDLENIPTSGFVLNKKAGGYRTGWNHRQTAIRVYDPRGFEFEISVTNLLYILENTNSMVGKGLEGEFVYGWDGAELFLIPTSAPEYQEMKKLNDILREKKYIRTKELILGATYKTKNNETLIFLGRFKKEYFFAGIGENNLIYFECYKSLGDKIIETISSECVSNYADLMDQLESQSIYSPPDPSKDEYNAYSFEEFESDLLLFRRKWRFLCFLESKEPIEIIKQDSLKDNIYKVREIKNHFRTGIDFSGTPKEVYEKFKPMYLTRYLENGRLFKKKFQEI